MHHAQILENCPATKNQVERRLSDSIKKHAPKIYAQIKGRVKTVQSTNDKIAKKIEGGESDYCLEKVTDILGFRVICHFLKDVPEIVGALLKASEDKAIVKCHFEPIRVYTTTSPAQNALIKDLEQVFKENNAQFTKEEKKSRYTSVHMVWTLTDDILPRNIEIQVRTVFEDAWSEIEHALKYKGSTSAAVVSDDMQILNTLVQGCLEFSDLIYSRSKTSVIEPINVDSVQPAPAVSAVNSTTIAAYRALAINGQLDDAIRGLDAEITLFGTTAAGAAAAFELKKEKGDLILEYGSPDDAFEYFEELTESNPDDEYLQFRFAECHKQVGDFQNSTKIFQKLFDQTFGQPKEFSFPSDSHMRLVAEHLPMKLAYCYWRLGEVSQAASVIKLGLNKLNGQISSKLGFEYLNSEAYYDIELIDSAADNAQEKYRQILDRLLSAGVGPDPKLGFRVLDTYVHVALKANEIEKAREVATILRASIKVKGSDDIRALNEFGDWKPISREEYFFVMSHVDAIPQ